MENISNTEQQIIAAARKIFIQKGLSGARMQDIADEAGINKAMLHYYYRSKEKLFDLIFDEAIAKLLFSVNLAIKNDTGLEEKITVIVNSYIDLLLQNPYIPLFVLHEVHQNPERIVQRFTTGPNFPDVKQFRKELQAAVKKGLIRKFDPLQVLITLLSLCVFPFVARPMIQGIFELDNNRFKKFIEARRSFIVEFMMSALRP